MTIITKTLSFFLIINLHHLKSSMLMLQPQIKLMILIIHLEVRNLKNIIKLTIKNNSNDNINNNNNNNNNKSSNDNEVSSTPSSPASK